MGADRMSHHCHAAGCERSVPPRMFVCSTHWRKLLPALQRAIWREYKPGQERTKNPHEAEEGCPVAWFTEERLLAESPFKDFYARMFFVMREVGRHNPW